jgi:phosphotransferase system  glucose/maltose/N-acetylglucosamine-specific IIC component
MKFRIPFIYSIIPAAIVVILLALGLWRNASYFLQPFVHWIAQYNVESFEAYLYGTVALVLIIPGMLMGAAVILIARHEDKMLKKKHTLEKARGDHNYQIDEILRSMEASLARIRESSEKIKIQTERIVEISKGLSADSGIRSLPTEANPENSPPRGGIAQEKFIGATDIYASSRRESFSLGSGIEDYPLSLTTDVPEFKLFLEKITVLLRRDLKNK